jgi:Protein of unknown function (DUF3501)
VGDVRKLGLDDISDLRAYERERAEMQQRVFDTKRLRRVALGPIMSVVFENALTVRYQIQEMARVEKLATDEQIRNELRVYNPLIPDPGELSATLFLELTDDATLREWLPKLVGIERSLVIRLRSSAGAASGGGDSAGGDGAGRDEVRSLPEESHAEQLTREDVTASVHYIRFVFTPDQVEKFAAGPAAIASDHPEYKVESDLSDETRRELLSDLRG